MKQSKFRETEIGEVPEEWDLLSIDEIGEVVGGGTPSTKVQEFWDGDIAWLTPRDLSNYNLRYVSRGERNISRKGLEKSSAKILPPNSVLLTTRAPVGYVAIARNDISTNQGFRSVIPKKGVSSEYLYYLLKNNTHYLKSHASGTTFGELAGSTLRSLKFAFPNFDEQKSIAKIFSDLESKIELNQKINKTLEAIGQAIFKHWFADFEFPNEKGKPYKSSGGEMVDSELGEIPRGWKIGELTEFLDFLEGPGIRNWQYTLGGTRFINIRLIKNNDIDIANANYVSNEEAHGKYKHFLLEEKDMIVSTSGTLGRTAIVRKKHLPLMLNTSVIRFRPIDAESYPFMYQYLNSSLFYNELKSLASGSVQLNFGPMHLKSMKMLMPAKEILNLYNKSVSCVYDKIVSNLDKSDILSHLRDSLLPRLMSGRIRVGINL